MFAYRACCAQAASAARIAALEGSVSSEHVKAVDEVHAIEVAKQALIVSEGVAAHDFSIKKQSRHSSRCVAHNYFGTSIAHTHIAHALTCTHSHSLRVCRCRS